MKKILLLVIVIAFLSGCMGGKSVKNAQNDFNYKLTEDYKSYKKSRPVIGQEPVTFNKALLVMIPGIDAKKAKDINLAAACISQAYEASALLADFYFEDADYIAYMKKTEDLWLDRVEEIKNNLSSINDLEIEYNKFLKARLATKQFNDILKEYSKRRNEYNARVKKMGVDAAKTLLLKYLSIDAFMKVKPQQGMGVKEKYNFISSLKNEGNKLTTLLLQAASTTSGLGIVSSSVVSKVAFQAVKAGNYTIDVSMQIADDVSTSVVKVAVLAQEKTKKIASDAAQAAEKTAQALSEAADSVETNLVTFAVNTTDAAGNTVKAIEKAGQLINEATGQVIQTVDEYKTAIYQKAIEAGSSFSGIASATMTGSQEYLKISNS